MTEKTIAVGKHILDTLTVGMYADNRIIFREYIQNAADAIDKAVTEGVLASRDKSRIDITIDPEKREIRIRDNGIGILHKNVYQVLDIGRSQKTHKENRGFRGIGRLGGLAYCSELQFITSYQGECLKTTTFWDCNELRKLLLDKNRDMSLIEAVERVVLEPTKENEESDEHYFEVILSGIIEGHDNLLDIDDIQDYLSQVAPIPLNCTNLTAFKKINEKLEKLGKIPEEFNVYLNMEQIYKPYKLQIRISDKKGEDNTDLVKDISFFEDYKGNGELFFLGWYGETELKGIIKNNNVNGLRVRKGNIQIGDNRTLDSFFGSESNQRFNRWFIGEIYVFDDNLIPNARRDDFEKNETYFKFKEAVEKTTTQQLAKLPYKFSKARSNEKAEREISQEIEKLEASLDAGITETERKQILEQVGELEKKSKRIKSKSPVKIQPNLSQNDNNQQPHQDELVSRISELKDKAQFSKNFIVNKLPSTMPRECKKVMSIVFEAIDRELPDEKQAKELKEHIVESLTPKGKENKR
jgi:hypothetical protein